MTVELVDGTIEARIVRLLLEMYPATLEDVRRELKARADLVDRTVKGLVRRGLVELEVLPDRTYVRLLRTDFAFLGRKESQRKRVRHRGRGPAKPKDYEGPMFG